MRRSDEIGQAVQAKSSGRRLLLAASRQIQVKETCRQHKLERILLQNKFCASDNGGMSNDDTRDDDATVKLPDDENKYDTKPGITAVLERINELGEQLKYEIETRFNALDDKLSGKIESLHIEMTDQFIRLNKKIDVLNRELLEVKAEQERHADRIGALESKPS